ncbi:hypothetical protein BJ085DRAFT_335, partial [Dimargaris cristalligena]
AYKLFQVLPEAHRLREHLTYYTSGVHLAGVNRTQAVWTQEQMRDFGLTDVNIVEYFPYLNYPREQRVAIVEPEPLLFDADLREPIVDEDSTSHLQRDIPPAFHGFSASGNVTGRLVYANYGRPQDFARLRALGVNMTDTIVLVRYGQVFRGLKVREAQEHGAVGVLIYSDPADDGAARGAVYPDGPWRPPGSVQRGSVQFLSDYPGDPLTPGVPAHRDAERLAREDVTNLPKIPSIPLSYTNALPLLRALSGHGPSALQAGSDWEGAGAHSDAGADPGVTYSVGPSEARVNLVNRMEGRITPIWNVVARIEGWAEPDRAVIVGNHRDAWVFGAADPGSGSAVLLETARSLGILLRAGWRPRRTIYLCSWDAEEYGLIGSTEWVEDHLAWLQREAVAYINVDNVVMGHHFVAFASPSLNPLIYQVTKDVALGGTSGSVYDQWVNDAPKKHQAETESAVGGADPIINADNDPPARHLPPVVHPLGSGSDFTAFLQHAGIAAMDFSFVGYGGTYHSAYDSRHWMEKFVDPHYHYHRAATGVLGGIALQLADASLLPLNLTTYADALKGYLAAVTFHDQVRRFTDKSGANCEKAVAQVAAVSDETDLELSKKKKKDKKKHDAEKKLAQCLRRRHQFNDQLGFFEQQFIAVAGIPSRPWYKHLVFAPGLNTGYASQPLPVLTESVE